MKFTEKLKKKYFIRKYINKKNNNPSDIKMWEI